MPPAAPGGNQSEGYMGPVWIILAVFLFGFAIWYFGHAFLVRIFFYFKLGEISLIHFFTDSLEKVRIFILRTPPDVVEFAQVSQIAAIVGYYLRLPVAILLSLMAVLLFFKTSLAKYRHIYSMESLLDLMANAWPQVTPIMHRNLVAEDIDTGDWAMAMQPMQFAKRYKLLQEIKPVTQGDRLDKEKRITVKLIRNRAERIFIMQLSRPWTGVEALNPHTKALYVAFLAKAARDANSSREFLDQVSASTQNGAKADFPGMDDLYEKHKNFELAKDIEKKHAYEFTVMASMLELARTDGVLSTSDFLWLKPVDRRLWYMLNSVGRQTAFIEVAGPFSHWKTEKELGRKIKTPMVQQAADALEEALKHIIYNPNTIY